jgi:hypothetical protein
MSSVTLSQQIGDRTVTLTYDDSGTDAATLARQASSAMTLLVAANRVHAAGLPGICDVRRKEAIAAHDTAVWADPCANPDPEERAA